ncbi:MAG: M1 family metallopeptidase [Defluviitaleaceae bacterium]|nr:M1 family metallopeptidase [Defluviitaleaceae bacterium]
MNELKKALTIFLLSALFLLSASCGRLPPSAPSESFGPSPEKEAGQESDENEIEGVPEEQSPPVEIPLYNEYAVAMEIEPESRTVGGHMRVKYTNRSETALGELVLRVYLNAFKEDEKIKPFFDVFEEKVFALGVDYGFMEIRHVSEDNSELSFELDGTVLTVILDEPLEPDETIQLRIQFEAYVPLIAHRTGANERAIWCGMFLPVLSVFNGSAWDKSPYYPAGDPFFLESANYTVEITAPSEYEIAGTGVKFETMLEDRMVTTFHARMARDFAFALSNEFMVEEAAAESGADVFFYHYSDDLDAKAVVGAAVDAIAFMEDRVGLYPYRQLTIVETDMFVSGGMEFSTIVFIDSDYLRRTSNYATVVHEVIHQWFYNIVGNNQIEEAWIDEGLTMYLQEEFFYKTEEELRSKMERDHASLKLVHDTVEGTANRRISSGIAGYTGWSDYHRIKYTKPKLMLYALRRIIGDDGFTRLLWDFFNIYSFRVATGNDFISVAEEVHGESLKSFFNEWLNGAFLPDLY